MSKHDRVGEIGLKWSTEAQTQPTNALRGALRELDAERDKERDQLRAELTREREQANEWLANKHDLEKELAKARAELEEAKRLHEDAYFAAAPPATEPLAAKYRCNSHVDCVNQGAPHENQQPATEPRREAVDAVSELGQALDDAGARVYVNRSPKGCTCPFPRDKCPRCAHPCGECEAASLAAPASAQGTTGHACDARCSHPCSERFEALVLSVDSHHSRLKNTAYELEALDKRVTALAELLQKTRELIVPTICALSASPLAEPPQPAPVLCAHCRGLTRFIGKGLYECAMLPQCTEQTRPIPQPAPVGTHAFVPNPLNYDCALCGQPRSAAVHETGDVNG